MAEHKQPDLEGVSIERHIETASDPETVWRHLTEGELANVWMSGDVQIEARPGGDIRLRRDGDPDVWGTVEEALPAQRIQWSWRTDDGMPTLVEIELAPLEPGTRLTVRETLLPWRISGPGRSWEGPVASVAATGVVSLAA